MSIVQNQPPSYQESQIMAHVCLTTSTHEDGSHDERWNFFYYSPTPFVKTKFLFIESTFDFYLIYALFTTNISSIYVVIFVYINWICQGIHLIGSITCCMRWKYYVLSCVQNHIHAYFVIVICYFLIFFSPHIRLSVLTSYRVFSLQSCPSDDRGPDTWRRSHAWWVEESHI